MTSFADHDPRVTRGIEAMLALRRERLAGGATPLGWKMAFGAPAALERLGLAGPVLGFLLREALVASGGSVPVGGWTRPVAEPEIAVHLVRDVPAGAGPDDVRAAIGALGSALELADVSFPPDDVVEVMAGNIYQRAVVLGPASGAGAGGGVDGLVGRVERDGREIAATEELEALTGAIPDLVARAAALLESAGEALRAGDVLIAGSVVPPLDVGPGTDLRFELEPYGAVEVSLVA